MLGNSPKSPDKAWEPKDGPRITLLLLKENNNSTKDQIFSVDHHLKKLPKSQVLLPTQLKLNSLII